MTRLAPARRLSGGLLAHCRLLPAPPLPLLQPVSMRQPSSTPPAASTLAVALEEAPAAALEINGGSGCQGGEAEMRTHVIKPVEQ